MSNDVILSVGHSTHSYEKFLSLLRGAKVTAIADVRSSPYSRHFPQFNREQLHLELKMDGVAYSFLGNELGGRPKNKDYFLNGVADYDRMGRDPSFREGIERVAIGSSKYRIALMCSEHNPLDCHRCLLVGRELKDFDRKVSHILSNGNQITQEQVEAELLRQAGEQNSDMFAPHSERLARAYRTRAQKVAYSYNGSSKRFAAE